VPTRTTRSRKHPRPTVRLVAGRVAATHVGGVHRDVVVFGQRVRRSSHDHLLTAEMRRVEADDVNDLTG